MDTFTRLPLSGSSEIQRFARKVDADEEPVPREVRAARRNAAAALALSLAVFGVSLVLVFRTAPSSAVIDADSPEAPSDSVIGLDSAQPVPSAQEPLLDGFSMANNMEDEGNGIIHPPYHLVTDSVLRNHVSGEPIRQMKEGTQIFPLKYRGSWVQVVVPKGEDGLDATFGWLPLQENGADLLERDHFVRNRPTGPRQPPPSEEEMKAKWDEVRAKNAELKSKLADLQMGVKDTYMGKIRNAKHGAESTVAKGAKEIFNVQELRKMVAQVRTGVHEEFKRSPEAVIKDLGHAIEE